MSQSAFIASPSVIAYAGRKGVELEEVAEKSGRINLAREDVDNHLTGQHGSAQQVSNSLENQRYWDVDHATYGPITEEPLSRFAKLASQNLSAANKIIPQVTHHDRADMRALEAFRTEMRAAASKRGTRLTALAFHVKALSICLSEFPRFNASLTSDGEKIILKHYCHIGIAVDTPIGLMVPVIRDVNRKGLWQIADEITDLASRAQARKIKPDEMGGASMSISNLGGIGGTAFTPIVNPPEVAILGLTRTQIEPIWENEGWQPVPMTPLDLSYDHRVINGADAARFLVFYAGLLSDPRKLVIY